MAKNKKIKQACSTTEERARRRLQALNNPKIIASFQKMIADSTRLDKIAARMKERNRLKKLSHKAAAVRWKGHVKKVKLPSAKAYFRHMFPHSVDSKGRPIYHHTWISPACRRYCGEFSIGSVLRYGRPRDPWGNFMIPKNPEKLFGADILFRTDQRFIQEGPTVHDRDAVCIAES